MTLFWCRGLIRQARQRISLARRVAIGACRAFLPRCQGNIDRRPVNRFHLGLAPDECSMAKAQFAVLFGQRFSEAMA